MKTLIQMENEGLRASLNTHFGSSLFSIFHFPFSILVTLLALTTLSSCDDPVDIDLNTASPYLVVDGALDDDSLLPDTVRLKTSIGYLENRPLPAAQGAQVIITGTDGQVDTLQEVVPGKYVTRTFVGRKRATYTLTIAWQGERYRATATMPRGIAIDSVRAVYKEKRNFQDAGYYIELYAQEPAGKGDYYKFEIMKNDTLQNLVVDLAFANDELVDGNYINGPELNFNPYKRGDRVTGYVKAITEDAFYFYTELQNTFFQGGLFAPPPANLRTNVQNLDPKSTKRATGYLFVYTIDQRSLICE